MLNVEEKANAVAQTRELIKPVRREADAAEVISLCEGYSSGPIACNPVFASADTDNDVLF